MIDKFVGTIRGIRSRHRSGFDSYFLNVQTGRYGGGPKIDEARKDFSNIIRSKSKGYLG